MNSKITYMENLTDWVLQFGNDPNPNHSQFSATEVANLIMKYNNEKLSGKL